jgi:hypothetical protein
MVRTQCCAQMTYKGMKTVILKQANGSDIECADIDHAERVQDAIAEQLARYHQIMVSDPSAARSHHKAARAVIDIYNHNEAIIARFAEELDIHAVTEAIGHFLDRRSRR